MLDFKGKMIADALDDIVQPKRTALILWDFQNDIALRVFNSEEILVNTQALTKAARRAGIPIFYSQQTSFDLDYETPVWIRIRMKRAKVSDPSKIPPRSLEGDKEWQIVDQLKPLPGDTVFKKRRPSAFIGTDVDLMLRNKGIETVLLTGATTESGIEGSARHGLYLGYYMVVVRDCVGSIHKDKHDVALKSMETFFEMVDSHQLISIWER